MCDHSEYVYSWPMTYGGAAGDYALASPWNGPAEMCIVSFTAITAQATAYISRSKTTAGATSSIATTGVAGASGTTGVYLDGTGTAAVGIQSYWWPVADVATMVTTGTFLVVIGWRRKADTSATQQQSAIFQHEAVTNG